VERAEAEAIYDAGREVVVEVLLRMDRRIQQLEARVEKLERQLTRNSHNSSVPPSADPPSAPSRQSKDPSGRSRGAQSGHEGHGRELLPTSAADEVIEHWPVRCECGHVFSDADRVAVKAPARHQIEELPELAVRVIEHRCEHLRCPDCGAHRTGKLPAEVAQSAFGRACRPRSRRCRCAIASPGATRSSFAKSCSAPGCALARSIRSLRAPAMHSPSPMRISLIVSVRALI
jgi:uncharacterized protein DUF6444